MRKLKVALCIPCHGDTKALFTQSIVDMVAFSSGATIEFDGEPCRLQFHTFMVSSSLLPESRNRLVAEAMNWDADYMLWMDADHVFPEDALLRLLSRNKLVIGCNYARRGNPTSPTASKYGKDDEMDLVWTTQEKAEAHEVEEVAHLGLGFCLIDMRLWAIMEAKLCKGRKRDFWPLFRIDPTKDNVRFVGEDVYFFKKIRKAGVPIYLDHNLSWELGHCSSIILMNAHTIAQKKQYTDWCQTKLDHMKPEAVE